MFTAIRHSKLVLSGLMLLVGSVVLCPHAAHERQCGAPDAADVQDHADHDAEHDHGHCAFDTTHTHDFRLSSEQDLVMPSSPPLICSIILPWFNESAHHPARQTDLAARSPAPLLQLGSVRLLI